MSKLSPKPTSQKYTLAELDNYLQTIFKGPDARVTLDPSKYDIEPNALCSKLSEAGYSVKKVDNYLEIK